MIPWTCSGYFYDVLDVGVDSSPDEIRCKYRALAMQYHPDKTGGTTTEKFKEISEAYQVLSNTDQRILYNKIGRQGMKQFASLGVPDFMYSLALLQASLFFIGCLIGTMAVSALLTCYKLDHADFALPWSLILLPIWAIGPLLVLIASIVSFIAIISADFRGVVGGLQILATAFAMITTAVAIAGVIDPVWAVIPWILLKLLNTLHRLHQAHPRTYRHQMLSEMGYDGASSEFSTLNEDNEDSYNYHSSNAESDVNHVRPYSTRAYLFYVAMLIVDELCTWTFLVLVLMRALQGPVVRVTTSSHPPRSDVMNGAHRVDQAGQSTHTGDMHTVARKNTLHVLSFYTVLAPLMLLSVVQGSVEALSACFAPAPVAWNANARASAQSDEMDEESAGVGLSRAHGADTPLLSHVKKTLPDAHARNAATHMGVKDATYHLGNGGGIHYSSSHADPASAGANEKTASVGSRLLAGLNASIVHLSLIYMYYMWATREEYEYNKNKNVSHPSAIKATLPLLVFLAIFAMLPFCLSWLVGKINSSSTPNTPMRTDNSRDERSAAHENQTLNNSNQTHTRDVHDNVPTYASTRQSRPSVNAEID